MNCVAATFTVARSASPVSIADQLYPPTKPGSVGVLYTFGSRGIGVVSARERVGPLPVRVRLELGDLVGVGDEDVLRRSGWTG